MKHVTLALWMLLAACGSKSPATDTDPPTDTCSALEPGACAQDAACRVITGQEIRPGFEGLPNCLFADEELGCALVDATCPAVEARAADPSDPSVCHQFATGCIPSGWVPCDPDPGPAVEACET